MKEVQKIQNEIKLWSDQTFGMYRTATPIAYHLKKEVDELIVALETHYKGLYSNGNNFCELYRKDRERLEMEFADCLMLLLDTAAHININVESLIKATRTKLEINRARTWGEPDENGVCEHIETSK